jgi:hypothetical protein
LAATRVGDDRSTLFQHRSKFLPPNCPGEFSSTLEKRLDRLQKGWSTYVIGLILCRVFTLEREDILMRRHPCIQFRDIKMGVDLPGDKQDFINK